MERMAHPPHPLSLRRRVGVIALSAAIVGCTGSGTDGGGGGGSGGEVGTGGKGGSGASSACGAANEVAGADATWESLPLLAAGPSDNAGQCGVSVDSDGVVTVWGSFAAADWAPPQRIEVHRYDGTEWQLVGGAPVAEGQGRVAGHAVDDADTSFALVSLAGEMRLFETDGSGWDEAAPIAADVELLRLIGDRLGRPVVLAFDGERARVFRRAGSDWSELGDGFLPGGGDVSLSAADLASDCQGRLVATLGGHTFWFEGDAWDDLGSFIPSGMSAAEFPRLAVGSDGRPVMAWRASDSAGDEIYASRFNPSSSEFELLDSPISFEGPGASYAAPLVDDEGRVFLTWRESTVYLAELRDGGWHPFAGDGDAAAHTAGGTLPSIALMPDGMPIVCWESIVDGDSVIGVGRPRAPD